MKRFALILALALLLSGCVKVPPPADTAPPTPPETIDVTEMTLPPETTEPAAVDSLAEYEALLAYTHPEHNWLWNALGCTFESPEQIDLYYLFYGSFNNYSWDAISAESEAYLIEQGFVREFGMQARPAAELDAVLQSTFGISLSDVAIPADWIYLEKEDMYCTNHNDTYGIVDYTVTAVEDDGKTIVIHYTVPEHHFDPATGSQVSADFVITLKRTESGTIQAVSNVPADQVTDFSQYEALLSFSADPNWLARSLGCLYEHPWKLDLYYLFYLGVGHPGSWNDISEESRRKLVNEGFLEEFDLQIMPVEKLEAALQETFGVDLSSVDIPEEWCYIEAEDAYCSNHSDAYFPGVPVITSVEDDGTHITIHYTMEGYWIPGSETFLDKADLILYLIRNDDGTIHAVSNLLPVN